MKQSYLIPLSIGILASISGCQLQERGMALPPPKVKPRPQPKKTNYDFPLLKLKAHTGASKKETQEVVKEPSSKSNLKDTKTKKKPSSISKKKTHRSKRIKKPKQKESVKIKKETLKPRRRKSGYARKLIFDKRTSIKEIPIPLPKASSLKLGSLSKTIPTIPLSKIPIVNVLLPKDSGSKTSHKRIKSNKTNLSQSGGETTSSSSNNSNLDMVNIRIGNSQDYTALIFDSYIWGGHNIDSTEEAHASGSYKFNYVPEHNHIVATLKGYSAFSALLGDQSELFKESDVIKNIYIDRYIGSDGIQFIITLKKKVKMHVTDVKDPARIIVNLYPK